MVLANPDQFGKWPFKWRERERTTMRNLSKVHNGVMLSTVHDPTVLMKNVSITPALYYSAHCIYIAQNIKKHKNMMLLYLNGHLSAATVFAEDIRGDTFEDFAECSAAEEHCKFDLFTTKMSQ